MSGTCTMCGSSFENTAADLQFYEGISVPPPSSCPACRSLLRCMHRNERSLHKRRCDACKRNIVTMYAPTVPFPVYCQACFYSDRWDASSFGIDCAPEKNFWEQLALLLKSVPRIGIMNKQSENSDYCNYSYANKNCYLTAGSHYEEDCLYGGYSTKNKDCVDSMFLYGSELLYECMFCKNCYHSQYLDHCEDSSECFFSRDLKGCKNCIFSANLRQKQYYVFNEPRSKEEYERTLATMRIDTFNGVAAAKKQYREIVLKKFPVRALYQVQCENCEGDTLQNCKNMRQCFFCADSEDCAYGVQVDGTYSSFDIDKMGYDRSERLYQAIGCLGLFDCIACNACWNGSGLRYCQYCFSCADCFACVSLQQKKYCILNKQYTKQEYEMLIPKIIAQMQSNKEFGAFFPANLSPFGYNESTAMDWLPLTREEALRRGYTWGSDEKMPKASKVIDAARLPDSIDDIPADVLNWALLCEKTKRPFMLTKKEFDFYKFQRIPVPHLHPDERHRARKALRNPCALWQRQCAKCKKPVQTSYAPERPETIYCEECYLETAY